MGNEEVDTPTKTPKSSSAQEQPPSSPAAVYPDWASFQAYYNTTGTPAIPPPGFFHSPVPSSQPHPYIWGQHMMPPYGTPPPYVAMYPHGGLYGHPSMPPGPHAYAPYAMPSQNGAAEASVAAAAGSELEGKSVEGKKKNSLKKSKGSLGSLSMLTGKGNEKGKTSGASANSLVSQSDESGNEGSSEGSDSSSQNGSQQKPHCEQSTLSAEEAKNGYAAGNTARVPPTPTMVGPNMAMVAMPPNGVAGPTTNLNIGMDYWGGPAQAVPAIRSKLPIAASTPSVVSDNHMGSRDHSELWLQDEREMKRQRRKQSNRESARRSRLRKQAECEELAQRVDTLKQENGSLREELERMREECQKLAAENASLSERLENHREGSRADADPIKASAVDTTDRGS